MSRFLQSVYAKVLVCKTTKEIYIKLQNIYEGDSKVTEEKLQIKRAQIEKLKMKEYENIVAFFQ